MECEFRKYAIFEGKLKDFRSEGGVIKTEDEKAAMADKHRFKKNRDFKQRLDETEANEEGDIRSFTFHHHELEQFRRKDTRERREDRGDSRRDFRKDDRRDSRSTFHDYDRNRRFRGEGNDNGKRYDKRDSRGRDNRRYGQKNRKNYD